MNAKIFKNRKLTSVIVLSLLVAAFFLTTLMKPTPIYAQQGGGNSNTNQETTNCVVSSTSTNCSEGSVTFISPTNTPVFCINSSVSLTANWSNTPGQVVIDTSYTNAGNSGSGACPDTYTTNTPSPTVVSNGWTASVGSYSTNGTGSTASFIPTDCGVGSVTFYRQYQDVCDTNLQTASGSASFESVQLQSISVSGATAIDTTNYAAVKTTNANDYVTITASLCPSDTNAASKLAWSGGNAVPGNPLQREVHKNASAETIVTASCCSTSITANVWIIWGTVSILTSGTNPSNAPQFGSVEDGTEILGIRYFDNSNAVAGKMCAVGTVTPSGVHSIITNGWGFTQMKWTKTLVDGSIYASWSFPPWTGDGPNSGFFTTSLDANDKLYTIDGPSFGAGSDGATSSVEMYKNFYDYITWNSQMCSDTNVFWHFEGKWTNSSPQFNSLGVGGGTISIP